MACMRSFLKCILSLVLNSSQLQVKLNNYISKLIALKLQIQSQKMKQFPKKVRVIIKLLLEFFIALGQTSELKGIIRTLS